MTFVDLRPDDVRPVRVLVDSQWHNDDLEAYRQDSDKHVARLTGTSPGGVTCVRPT
jgi:hypothetical protein